MRTKLVYYLILFVYVTLWLCQLVACHLTHSLIILTDSYINLYRIFDISLGLLHLSTQEVLSRNRALGSSCGKSGFISINDKVDQTAARKFFNYVCTYQYKRLPLLGSFVNGMFLAALLFLAAIEGIQTCLHVQHSKDHDRKTILTENTTTYPLILVGFAFVGLIMQYCSLKAHEMREEELCSESYLDLKEGAAEQNQHNNYYRQDTATRAEDGTAVCMKQLSVTELSSEHCTNNHKSSSGKRRSYDLTHRGPLREVIGDGNQRSLQSIPLEIRTNEVPHDEPSHISLRSLKFPIEPDNGDTNIAAGDKKAAAKQSGNYQRQKFKLNTIWPSLQRDNLFLVRCLTSPVAMIICAAIFYLVEIELMTEISDAALAVSVVVLLFAASYPPMKKAGIVLLQAIPDTVDLSKLRRDLERCGQGEVIEIQDLTVWSLSTRSNRVATCRLMIDSNMVKNKGQVQQILREAKCKFLDQRIMCTTIEPVLISCDQLKHGQQQQQQLIESQCC